MDINVISKNLGIVNLQEYIIEEILIGKKEAESNFENIFHEILKGIENIDSDEVKVITILTELIKTKNEIELISNDYLSQMFKGAKERKTNSLSYIKKVNDELVDVAKYIIDYFDFNKTSDLIIQSKLKSIRNLSKRYHLGFHYIEKTKVLFKILNTKCKLDGYTWKWENFDVGLKKVLFKYGSDLISIKIDSEHNIEIFELNKRHEIEDLKSKIENLKKDIIELKKENESIIDFYNKYYYNSQVIIKTTYFGDNLPFLFNLFKFFKQNNLLSYGWSYFYNCMEIGNTETVSLTTSKKLNFVGRIFYHLCDYLILHYNDEPFRFLQSKFLINGKVISNNFRTNHMKVTYDKMDYPELITIDDFFENQKKIYLKM